MRITKSFGAVAIAIFLSSGIACLFPMLSTALAVANAATVTPNVTVGPQYDTTHVYVGPEDFDRFVASLVATFGGTTSKQGVFTVTPTPSSTMSQLVLTPVGTLSVFGFKTPVPYPFGAERTGYLVWSARLEMCQWRRETLDKESIWDEVRSTSRSRW
jgi:hypothetical protein